jgi:murein tripeptide amidase MpaA
MMDIRFDQFYRYEALTQLLKRYTEDYPHLVKLQSPGASYEGRAIWIVVVTHFATGPDTEKPAFWIDGNIHATELTPSTLCLYHLHTLVTRYGVDDDITRCLDTRVFYICPRVNPDGAEWALADRPKLIRSSTRPYPHDEAPIAGLMREDIDGDGRILTMRIPDANGAWKPHPGEPRLLIRREPTDVGGLYYRLLPEGRLENYDGVTLQTQPPRERLDLNRNYPMQWRPEAAQRGAGPFPTSEPEIRAMVDFIINHPNIVGGVSFHTYGGLIMRPYSMQSDDTMPSEDLWTYQAIGQKGTELTGYPNISVFHEFLYHPKEVTTGAFDDWMYDHLGAFSWTVELWSPQRQAGITDYK